MGSPVQIESVFEAADESESQEIGSPVLLKGAGLIFVRRSSTYGIGHVGWGFLVPDVENPNPPVAERIWSIGAVENPTGWLFVNPNSDGYWKKQTQDPLSPMIMLGYDQYKILPVVRPKAWHAMKEEEKIRTRDYSAAGINCMNDVHDVLKAYGAKDLPNPQAVNNWFPNAWFDHIRAEMFAIEDVCGLYKALSL